MHYATFNLILEEAVKLWLKKHGDFKDEASDSPSERMFGQIKGRIFRCCLCMS